MRAAGRAAIGAVTAALSLVWSSPAFAQAWLPPKGEGSVSLLYSNVSVKKHYLPTTRLDIGHVDRHTLLMDVTYGLTDRTAISVSLPLVIGRYTGLRPHQPTNPDRLDDGRWHATISDVRFNLRRGFRAGPVAVAPFIGTVLPSHQYEFWAHSAPGRRIRELAGGVTAATLLDGITPGLFLQGQYSFAFAERVLDVRPNHSNFELELGYFASEALRVFVAGTAQVMHDGIDIFPPGVSLRPLTPEQIQHHDQIGRENYLNLAAGASVTLRDGLDLYGAFMKQVAGRNGHEINRALSVGISVRFGRQAAATGSGTDTTR